MAPTKQVQLATFSGLPKGTKYRTIARERVEQFEVKDWSRRAEVDPATGLTW